MICAIVLHKKKETGLAINAGRFPLIVVSRWFDEYTMEEKNVVPKFNY